MRLQGFFVQFRASWQCTEVHPKKGSTVAWHAPVQYLLEASWEHPSIKVFSIDSIAYKHTNIKTTQLHALALQPFPCMCHSTYTLSVRHEVARLPVSKLNVYHLLVCWHPQDNTLFNNIYTTQLFLQLVTDQEIALRGSENTSTHQPAPNSRTRTWGYLANSTNPSFIQNISYPHESWPHFTPAFLFHQVTLSSSQCGHSGRPAVVAQ